MLPKYTRAGGTGFDLAPHNLLASGFIQAPGNDFFFQCPGNN